MSPMPRYHRIELVDGVKMTRCTSATATELALRPNTAGFIRLGRSRTRCPRCGAKLQPWRPAS